MNLKASDDGAALTATALAIPNLPITPSSLQTVSHSKNYALGGSRTAMIFTFSISLNLSNTVFIYFSKIYT